jgi:hypothetical protein
MQVLPILQREVQINLGGHPTVNHPSKPLRSL